MSNGANSQHYNQVLTDVAVQFRPPDLVARDVFIPDKVTKESDLYRVYDMTLFDAPDDIRADGDESRSVEMGFTLKPYQCVDHALHAKVTDREKRNSDYPEGLEDMKAEAVKQSVLNRLEANVFGTNGIGRAAGSVINSRNLDWSNPATAQLRRDVTLLIEDVEVASGLTPNVIIASKAVFRAMMRTTEYKEEAKYTNDLRSDNDIPTQFYGLRTVTVASLLNTAAPGLAVSLARVMGEDVIVAYIDPSGLPNRGLTWAVTLYTEEYVNSWYKPEKQSTFVEYGMIYVPHIVARECAAMGTSVMTA